MSCYTNLDIVYERYRLYVCIRVSNQTTRVGTHVFGVCDMRVRRVSLSFSVELVAGLYRIVRITNKAI